ncbi:hypothetical protein FRB94_005463 [Tulasnella sp. JGI-2019a]|nr:hypothetical protein FRB93_005659 [Tulasnella sp. JGI-2019a]KAG9000409.1 hypothetical protein FRB94_005463 [Tulasnella sp. JGI-2019a]KAG9031775.1 hypothetical protein FRB95_002315 [Tulasnella sp. JGI-2019a]
MSQKYIVVFKKTATDAQIAKYADDVNSGGGQVTHHYTDVLRGFPAKIPNSLLMNFQGNEIIDYIGSIEPDEVVTIQ